MSLQFWLKSNISNCGSDTIFLGQRGQRPEWKGLFITMFSIIHFLLMSVDRSWPLGAGILSWAQAIGIHILSRQRAQRWLLLPQERDYSIWESWGGELVPLGRWRQLLVLHSVVPFQCKVQIWNKMSYKPQQTVITLLMHFGAPQFCPAPLNFPAHVPSV